MIPCCTAKGCRNPPCDLIAPVWLCSEHAGVDLRDVDIPTATGSTLDAIAGLYGLRREVMGTLSDDGLTTRWDRLETDVEFRSRIKAALYRVSAFKNAFGTPKPCTHEFVEMGFMHSKMVCKHCDQEQK